MSPVIHSPAKTTPRMCVIACAWGDDEERVVANLRAMEHWQDQTIQPYYVLVEALKPGEESRYAGVIPDGGGEHVIVEYDPWTSRGIMLKEALQNIGASHAPDTCDLFVFVDADVWSEDPRWLEGMFSRLEEGARAGEHALVQGFSNWRDSDDVEGVTRVCSAGYAATSDDDISLAHPGMCWGMPRELWLGMGGLNDQAINGSGDALMLHELAPAQYAPWAVTTNGWLKDAVRPCPSNVELSCVPVGIVHENHGPLDKRGYAESWQVIDRIKTPAADLVKLNKDGIPVWINPDCRLADLLASRGLLAESGVDVAMRRSSLLTQVDPDRASGHMGSARACRHIMDNAPKGARIVEYGAGLGQWSAHLAVVAHNAGRGLRLESYDSFARLPSSSPVWREPAAVKHYKSGETTTKGICRRRMDSTGAEYALKEVGKATKLAKDQKQQAVWSIWFTSGHDHVDACLEAWWEKIMPGGCMATHADDDTFSGIRKAFSRFADGLGLDLIEEGNSLLLCKPLECQPPDLAGKSPFDADLAPGQPQAPPTAPLDDTALILGYANGEGSELRRKATATALTKLLSLSPSPLIVFYEVVFPGQNPQFEQLFERRANTSYHCIRGTEQNRGAWPKEAIYELAVRDLPTQYTYFIFGDADMFPDKPSFARQVRNVLEDRDVLLQAYSSWTDTGDVHFSGYMSFAAHPRGCGSPGGYWAMRRELHARLGGFCVEAYAGGGDGLIPINWTSKFYPTDHMEFESFRRLVNPVDDQPKLECLNVSMIHVFHGNHKAAGKETGTRAYRWRYWVTDLDGRCISDIVRTDSRGLLEYIQVNDPLQYCMLHKSDMFDERSARATYNRGCELQRNPKTGGREYDQAWWIANPVGGMGSAMRGAVRCLEQQGDRILIVNKHTLITKKLVMSAGLWVIGGLPLSVHNRIRSISSTVEIVFQCHSPWLFLANEPGDFKLYLKCMRICETHPHTHMAHVAEREYLDACLAFGDDRVRLIPAVYEGEISQSPGDMGGPVVVAHQARKGKNIAGQLLAGAAAAVELGVPLHWYRPTDLSRIPRIDTIWKMVVELYPGLEVSVKAWTTQAAFRAACREASVGMCATWCDAYSQVACDFLAQGTPIVASHSQWFAEEFVVNPDDVPEMAAKAVALARDESARPRSQQLIRSAQNEQKAHLHEWRKSI